MTKPKIRRRGKTIANKIPIFKLLPKLSDTYPTKVGPREQPKSPARAKNANMEVPPPRIVFDAMLKVPGQRIPTEKPHNAQPAKLIAGLLGNEANK